MTNKYDKDVEKHIDALVARLDDLIDKRDYLKCKFDYFDHKVKQAQEEIDVVYQLEREEKGE